MSSHGHTTPPAPNAHDAHDAHAHGAHDYGAHDAQDGGHHHVLPLKVYYGVWVALMFLTALTIAGAYEPFPSLRVPVALGIATVKATLVALFFMHLLYDEKFNLMLLVCAVGTALIFLSFTIIDPITRGMVNPISLHPIMAEMTTTTLEIAPALRKPPPNPFAHHHVSAASEEHQEQNVAPPPVPPQGGDPTPIPVAPADVTKEAENAHPGVDKPQQKLPPH